MNCEATNAAGEPCGAPSRLVDPETRRCPAHAPGGADRMRQISAQGGKATKEKIEREPVELEEELGPMPPPPESVEDIRAWLSWGMAAVASDRIDTKTSHEIGYLARAMLDCLEKVEVEQELTELREQIRKFRNGELEEVA